MLKTQVAISDNNSKSWQFVHSNWLYQDDKKKALVAVIECDLGKLHLYFFAHCPEYYEAWQTLFDNIQSIDKMFLSQNESSLTHFFTVTLNATPMLNYSSSTRQLNLCYLQENSMDRSLTELKMSFFFL